MFLLLRQFFLQYLTRFLQSLFKPKLHLESFVELFLVNVDLGHIEPYAQLQGVCLQRYLFWSCFSVHGHGRVLIDDSGQVQDGLVVLFEGLLVLF